MTDIDLNKTIGELTEIADILSDDIEKKDIIKTKDDTLESIEVVLDYTKEEKIKIDELMYRVSIIDDMIEKGKKIYGTQNYGLFMVGYTNMSARIKKHFVGIFEGFSIIGAEEKIRQLLDTPLNNGVIEPSIKQHIKKLVEINPDYNFAKFNSKTLDNIIQGL